MQLIKVSGEEKRSAKTISRRGRVNEPLLPQELDAVRHSVQRGNPLGDAAWVEWIARRLKLESTLRPRGRPKSPPDAPKEEA
jgi:putative transposase